MFVNGEGAIAAGRSQIGYNERSGNRTKFGQWYGMDGVAWCAIFVSWCYASAGTPLAISTSRGYSLVQAATDWAKRNGLWRPAHTTPQRGWIGQMRIPGGPPRDNHTFIVQGPIDGGAWTIEGNTNGAGSRTGGSVLEKHRRSHISGYIALPMATQAVDWKALRIFLAAKTLETLRGCPDLHKGENSLYVAVYKSAFNIATGTNMVVEKGNPISTMSTLDLAAAQINHKRWMNSLGANITDPDGICGAGTRWWLAVGLDRIVKGA